MEPPRQAPKRQPLSWSQLNPFNDRNRQQDNSGVDPNRSQDPNPRRADKIEDEDPNADPNKKKSKNPGEGDDPMFQFDSLWQPNKNEKGEVIQQEDNSSRSYLPNLDPKRFDDFVGKMNFTQDIDDTDMEALRAGGDGGIKATLNIMNKVARRTMKGAFAASNRITEQGFSNASTRFMSEVPNHVRDMLTENELSGSVTIMQNPAFAPMVNMIKNQYLSKFPKATPRQVNTAVQQYFDYFGTELTKKTPQKDGPRNQNSDRLRKGDPEADFFDWITDGEGAAPQDGMFRDGVDDEDNSQQR